MKKHRHIGSYGIILKGDEIVLIKKAHGPYTGLLDLPGGSFEHGETPEETVIREINEETGLIVKSLELFHCDSCTVEWEEEGVNLDTHHIMILYKAVCEDGELKREPDGLDSNGAEYYEIDKLSVDNLSPLVKIALGKLS